MVFKKQLLNLIEKEKANDIWFRLVLLEAMLFEPYYPLSVEKIKKELRFQRQNIKHCRMLCLVIKSRKAINISINTSVKNVMWMDM